MATLPLLEIHLKWNSKQEEKQLEGQRSVICRDEKNENFCSSNRIVVRLVYLQSVNVVAMQCAKVHV